MCLSSVRSVGNCCSLYNSSSFVVERLSEMWRTQCQSWDEDLRSKLADFFRSWCGELHIMNELTIKWCYFIFELECVETRVSQTLLWTLCRSCFCSCLRTKRHDRMCASFRKSACRSNEGLDNTKTRTVSCCLSSPSQETDWDFLNILIFVDCFLVGFYYCPAMIGCIEAGATSILCNESWWSSRLDYHTMERFDRVNSGWNC